MRAELTGQPATQPAPGSNWTSRETLPAEQAILAHPDQRTTWAPALRARLREPLTKRAAQSRLDVLAVQHSIIGARYAGGRWTVHPAPPIVSFGGERSGHDHGGTGGAGHRHGGLDGGEQGRSGLAALCGRFDLSVEAPLRVALSPDGLELALASHHAALDGRALVAIARALVGAETGLGRILRADDHDGADADAARRGNGHRNGPGDGQSQGGDHGHVGGYGQGGDHGLGDGDGDGGQGGDPGPGGAASAGEAERLDAGSGGKRAMLRRLAQPADRVAPSSRSAGDGHGAPASGAGSRTFEPGLGDAFVALDIEAGRRLRVAAVAAAAVDAVAEWNATRDEPWRRIGLTIPVGGPDVIGNVSTHRRVDLRAGADVEAAVSAALGGVAPPDGGSALVARLLAPVVDRFSDSLLVSNLGRLSLPGAELVDFYPQARGRSAVAIGAATVDGGARRLTLRARDLSDDDARHLLALIAEHLPRG